MQRSRAAIMTLTLATAVSLTLGTSGAWAKGTARKDMPAADIAPWVGMAMGGMMHSSTGHLIRHLLKHEKDIGLTADQVAKLKDIQLNLDKTRIKAEAEYPGRGARTEGSDRRREVRSRHHRGPS